MTYWLSPGQVHANKLVLEAIHQAVEQGLPELRFPVRDGRNVATERYKLAEALKSAEQFPDASDGRFTRLRQSVTVRYGDNEIVVKVKRSVQAWMEAQLAQLKTYPGRYIMLEFPRDVDESRLAKESAALGWQLVTDTRDVTSNGTVSYALKRETTTKPKASGDVLRELGFRPH